MPSDQEKIDRIFEKTPNKRLLQWMRLKAMVDSKFAIELFDEFWKPDKKDVSSLVEACFMHPYPTRGLKYFWPDVIKDLESMMDRAEKDIRKKDFVEAAEISRLVIILTCKAYKEDFTEYQRFLAPVSPIIRRAETLVRQVLIEGDDIDEDSRRGMLLELLDDCISIKDNPAYSPDWLIEEAGVIAWPMRQYLTFINAKLRRKRDIDRHRHIANKVKCLALHGEKGKIVECLEKELNDEHSRMLYADCLIEWQEYDKALQLVEDRPETVYFLNWTDKEFEILEKAGDKEKAVDYCRHHFIKADRRLPYYLKLKELVPVKEWKPYLEGLLKECDFQRDYDDTEVKIYIEEGLTERMPRFFDHKGGYDTDDLTKYGQHIRQEDKSYVVSRFIASILERSSRFERKESFIYAANFLNLLLKFHPESKSEIKEAAHHFVTLVNPRYSSYLCHFRTALKV